MMPYEDQSSRLVKCEMELNFEKQKREEMAKKIVDGYDSLKEVIDNNHRENKEQMKEILEALKETNSELKITNGYCHEHDVKIANLDNREKVSENRIKDIETRQDNDGKTIVTGVISAILVLLGVIAKFVFELFTLKK